MRNAKWRRNPNNRKAPLPAEIRELVAPGEFISTEVKAREIAARIVGAITQFGWNNGTEARLYIGPEGWSAVERQGGWMHLCQNTGVTIQPTTLQAQLRDQIEGSLRYGAVAILGSIDALPHAEIRRLADQRPLLASVQKPGPTNSEKLATLIRDTIDHKFDPDKDPA
jgi:hypothetical protein